MSKSSVLCVGLIVLSATGCERVANSASGDADGAHAEAPLPAESARLGKPPKNRQIRDLPSWVTVPGGVSVVGSREPGAPPPREVVIESFWMTRTEITTAQFARFLNDTGRRFESPQFVGVPGRYAPLAARDPVAFVSYADAEAYARWLASRLESEVRLPTEEEWEHAARGGIFGAPYPWGWSRPINRAAFNLDRARPVGSYPPNGYGLYEMAGNLAEWCVGAENAERAPARGGSWSERSENMLYVWQRVELPRAYRDADVGFRVIARPRK